MTSVEVQEDDGDEEHRGTKRRWSDTSTTSDSTTAAPLSAPLSPVLLRRLPPRTPSSPALLIRPPLEAPSSPVHPLTNHIKDNDILDHHNYILLKSTVRCYLKIRLHNLAKTYSEELIETNVQQTLSKLILLHHQ